MSAGEDAEALRRPEGWPARLALPDRLSRRRALGLLATGTATLVGLAGCVPAGSGTPVPAGGFDERRRDALARQVPAEEGATAAGEPSGAEPRAIRVFYSADYVLAAHSFETTRKARWVADSLAQRPLSGLQLGPPEPLTEADVKAVHAPHYVDAVRTGQPRALAQSQGFT